MRHIWGQSSLNPATADKKLTAEEKEELKKKEFEQEVSKSREAAILAVESGVAVRKDGAVSKKKLKETLSKRQYSRRHHPRHKRGVITPISPTEFKVVNPAKNQHLQAQRKLPQSKERTIFLSYKSKSWMRKKN